VNWRPYLIWTETPFIIHTDHANLLHWKEPQNLNHCTARWHAVLQDYNFKIEHVPSKDHQAANALSHPPGTDEGKDDNQNITMLPQDTFIQVLEAGDPGTIEDTIIKAQE
jgi:hypothetical protein